MKTNYDNNEESDETMTEGSDMPPAQPEVTEGNESPVQEYFDSLDDNEKQELCAIVKEYEAQGQNSGELDAEGVEGD